MIHNYNKQIAISVKNLNLRIPYRATNKLCRNSIYGIYNKIYGAKRKYLCIILKQR